MFRIEFFVNDKHLADTLRGLTGKAFNLNVVPVDEKPPAAANTNGVAKNGNRDARMDLFATMLAKSKAERITLHEIKKIMAELGLEPLGSNTFIKRAIEKGVLLPKTKGDKRGSGYRVAR